MEHAGRLMRADGFGGAATFGHAGMLALSLAALLCTASAAGAQDDDLRGDAGEAGRSRRITSSRRIRRTMPRRQMRPPWRQSPRPPMWTSGPGASPSAGFSSPWSPPPRRCARYATQVRRPDGRFGPGQAVVHVPAVIALRNVGEEDLAVACFPTTASSPSPPREKMARPPRRTSSGGRRLPPPTSAPPSSRWSSLARSCFIGPMGESRYGAGFTLPLGPGKWKFHAAFASWRDAEGKRNLWTGSIESRPVEVTVENSKS